MPRIRIRALGRNWPSFQVCGGAGLLLAVGLGMVLTARSGLSYPVFGATVLAACLTFLLLVLVTRLVTGEERVVHYHHVIAVIAVAAALLRLLGQPVLPYLDITVLGIGAFLACGRIGCLMVGCCHGRPWRWGVCYGEEHSVEGFDSRLTGVPLFPVQAIESAWALAITQVGAVRLWTGATPGAILAWYLVAYGLGRFMFEFARGDSGRSYWLGLSEAQWWSLLLVDSVVWAERRGALPSSGWHAAAGAGLSAAFVALAVTRRWRRRFELLHPRHIGEVAGALRHLLEVSEANRKRPAGFPAPAPIPVVCTTLGVRISGGTMRSGARFVEHYSLSSAAGRMDNPTALTMAGLIRRLRPGGRPYEWIAAGSRGTHHVLIPYATEGSNL